MTLVVVVGGQAGSEGKGAVCGALHQREKFDIAVRVGGPNAGHTVYDEEGNRFAFRQLPVAAVVDHDCQLVIGAGSEVDFEVLMEEIQLCEDQGHEGVRERLIIDKEATVLEPGFAEVEKSLRHGTTGKGIGAARAARAMRKVRRVSDFDGMYLHSVDTQSILRERLREGASVMLEGTQGYILGSHAGFYPYCTSGDCRAIDMMAAAGIPPWPADVWVVLRTHPIRIAGKSGPLEKETTWEELGLMPEITTVTKKVRRVGQWNLEWARASVEANRCWGGSRIALTFADYWWPSLSHMNGTLDRENTTDSVCKRLTDLERDLGAKIEMLGTGPRSQLFLEGSWNGAE